MATNRNIEGLLENQHGVLMFKVCIELPTINKYLRRIMLALKYHPRTGIIYIVIITRQLICIGKTKRSGIELSNDVWYGCR